MKLIVISNPININNEHILLCSLFEAGLEYFHLRKLGFSKEEVEIFIQQIPEKYLEKIVLHSHHELVEKCNLKSKHRPSNCIELNENSSYISTSFHSFKEIESNKEKYDYVFLSPIFDSISKPGYHSQFNRSELTDFFNRHTQTVEIIALGGIDEHTIEDAMTYGFDGVALLGAIWNSKNPLEKFKRLQNICKKKITI